MGFGIPRVRRPRRRAGAFAELKKGPEALAVSPRPPEKAVTGRFVFSYCCIDCYGWAFTGASLSRPIDGVVSVARLRVCRILALGDVREFDRCDTCRLAVEGGRTITLNALRDSRLDPSSPVPGRL